MLNTIGTTFETGRDKAGTAGNEPVLKANWQIGQLLDKSAGKEERAPYAEQLIDRISEDLNAEPRPSQALESMYAVDFAKEKARATLRWARALKAERFNQLNSFHLLSMWA